MLYIPAGTVHAIGPGTLLYEVQQSSNTTYRLYDWGRVGLDGTPRELHIEKGVQVSNVDSVPAITHPGQSPARTVTAVQGDYFITTLHNMAGHPLALDTNGTHFHTLTCIAGDVTVSAGEITITLPTGRSAFIPAAVGAYTLSGDGQVLRSAQV